MRKSAKRTLLLAGGTAVAGLGSILFAFTRRSPQAATLPPVVPQQLPSTTQIPSTEAPAQLAPRAPATPSGAVTLDPGKVPIVGPAAAKDVAGQRRNYADGYRTGLSYRFGGSFIKTPSGEPGFEPFFNQGEADGNAAARPRIDDPQLLQAWTDALGKPAVGEPGGPEQEVS